jgi:hypothetical protein
MSDDKQPPFLTGVPEELIGDSLSDDELIEYGFNAGVKWKEWQNQSQSHKYGGTNE